MNAALRFNSIFFWNFAFDRFKLSSSLDYSTAIPIILIQFDLIRSNGPICGFCCQLFVRISTVACLRVINQ